MTAAASIAHSAAAPLAARIAVRAKASAATKAILDTFCFSFIMMISLPRRSFFADETRCCHNGFAEKRDVFGLKPTNRII